MTDDCIENYTYLFDRNLLKGKVALITGGGSGIGFTITEIFMRHGCDAVIVSRDIKKLSTAAEKLSKATGRKCLAVVADVRKGQEVLAALDQALAEFNHIDIVVNCAAGNFLCPLSNMSFNAFKVVMEIDAQGTFNVSKAAYEKYLRDNGGVILNITATLYYRGNVLQAHAGAAKAAVDALTKHMATEWGSNGIRVVGLAPGAIANTVGFNKLGGAALSDSIKSGIPLNRFGTRHEIAEAALFLVADTARYVTGETLIVDGGAWMTFGVGMDHGMQRIGAVQSTSKL